MIASLRLMRMLKMMIMTILNRPTNEKNVFAQNVPDVLGEVLQCPFRMAACRCSILCSTPKRTLRHFYKDTGYRRVRRDQLNRLLNIKTANICHDPSERKILLSARSGIFKFESKLAMMMTMMTMPKMTMIWQSDDWHGILQWRWLNTPPCSPGCIPGSLSLR